ncbi:MAG: histidine phosphatase family protein [Chloroflexota bacterium]
MTEPTYTITFLRHGESVGNAEGRYQGQTDFPLTDLGRRQARALGDRWLSEGRAFDKIIASPLPRARETAEIIAAALGLDVETDPLWMERANGLMAGLKHEDIRARDLEAPFLHPYLRVGQTGESELELYLRAGRGIQGLLDRPPERYLVVSHGALLNKTLMVILGIPVQANFQGASFSFGNTAFADFTYTPSGHRWRLKRFESP